MEDLAPKLIDKVAAEFQRLYEASGSIRDLLSKVKGGTATYTEAQKYALEVSRLIGKAYERHVSSGVLPDGRMYYNIASRLLPETLDENHQLVSQYAADVQAGLNKKAGISLKAQTAELDEDRVAGLVELASKAEQYDDVSDELLSAFETFLQNVVDETVRKNADFHYRSGMSPKIVRRSSGKCCEWCRALVGIYDYPLENRDIYRRHGNCRCTVLYDPADGSKSYQNVHSKQWQDEKTIEQRKNVTGIEVSTHKQIAIDANRNPENVTALYARQATPGIGKIVYEDGYERGKHSEEIKVAQWIFDNLGGDIVLLAESTVDSVKRSDYLWNESLWELKSITSAKAADSAVRKGIKQIFDNPGGIILDIGQNDIDVSALKDVVNNRMMRSNSLQADVMLIKQGKMHFVLRYKK